ncbi:MAG: lytic transglycosylase domain-containing protein [Vulcanimicrobiaceae bacterium]
MALSWPAPGTADELVGARVLEDGGLLASPQLALTRAILHTNQRIAPVAALELAGTTIRAARAARIQPEFLGATLLQESAYDPDAVSSAGAVGIAQFMPETAAGAGVDPRDPASAIPGAAALLSSYVRAYDGRFDDPYAVALAAYNAGPGAVDRYGGVPPYPETTEYIADIYERWARIAGYERPATLLRTSP